MQRSRTLVAGVGVGAVCIASRLPRMPRVTCDNSVLVMVHTLPSLPPDERQQGAACEGEERRTERRGRGVFCPPRERLAGRRVAAEGARKKMIYRGGHPFLVETEKSRVGLEAGRRHRLLAFLFFFNSLKKSILDHFFFFSGMQI